MSGKFLISDIDRVQTPQRIYVENAINLTLQFGYTIYILIRHLRLLRAYISILVLKMDKKAARGKKKETQAEVVASSEGGESSIVINDVPTIFLTEQVVTTTPKKRNIKKWSTEEVSHFVY